MSEMKKILEIKEVSTYEEANRLLDEGWIYLNVNISTHPTTYILAKTIQCE